MGLFSLIRKKQEKGSAPQPIHAEPTKDESQPLWLLAHQLIGRNDKEAERILQQSEKENQHDPFELHFVFNTLIKLYSRKPPEDRVALEKCIDYCKKDISLFPAFMKAYIHSERDKAGVDCLGQVAVPRIPSFAQLILIYEKIGNYNEAAEICRLGIRLGLQDQSIGSFESKMEELLTRSSNHTLQ